MNAGWLDDYVGLRHRVLPRPEFDALLGDMVQARDGGDRRTFERFRNRVAASMLRFVVQIARRFRGRGVEVEDLVSLGAMGLLRSLETWSPGEDHASIVTYGQRWIVNFITRAIVDLGAAVRRPGHVHSVARKVARVQGKFRERHGREPAPEEVAALVDLPIAAVQRSLALGSGATLSLDAPVHTDEGEELSRLDVLSAPDEQTPEDFIVQSDCDAWAHELLEAIPRARDRAIVATRYGVGSADGEPVFLEEVGERFGLTRERVRQISNEALDDMAKHARQAEWKRLPSTKRPALRLVPPPVAPPIPPPPHSSPKMRATVKGDEMREDTSLGEMVRIERALEDAARSRRKRAKAAADARQAARAKEKREAKRAEEGAHRRRLAEGLARTKNANRARATASSGVAT